MTQQVFRGMFPQVKSILFQQCSMHVPQLCNVVDGSVTLFAETC